MSVSSNLEFPEFRFGSTRSFSLRSRGLKLQMFWFVQPYSLYRVAPVPLDGRERSSQNDKLEEKGKEEKEKNKNESQKKVTGKQGK